MGRLKYDSYGTCYQCDRRFSKAGIKIKQHSESEKTLCINCWRKIPFPESHLYYDSKTAYEQAMYGRTPLLFKKGDKTSIIYGIKAIRESIDVSRTGLFSGMYNMVPPEPNTWDTVEIIGKIAESLGKEVKG